MRSAPKNWLRRSLRRRLLRFWTTHLGLRLVLRRLLFLRMLVLLRFFVTPRRRAYFFRSL
jgi:hypothetical protein